MQGRLFTCLVKLTFFLQLLCGERIRKQSKAKQKKAKNILYKICFRSSMGQEGKRTCSSFSRKLPSTFGASSGACVHFWLLDRSRRLRVRNNRFGWGFEALYLWEVDRLTFLSKLSSALLGFVALLLVIVLY